MPYNAEISRTNPTCFVFLVDQSSSMNDVWGVGSGKTKAEGVADALNRLLQTLVLRCAKAEGIRDYFHIGVIGYGKYVGPVLCRPPINREPAPLAPETTRTATVLEGVPGSGAGPDCLMPVSKVADKPLRVESRVKHVDDGAGGVLAQTIKFPVWFEPVAYGATPMCEAMDLAWHVVTDFLGRFPHCYPPTIINVTDGEATDGDPETHAKCLRDLASTDGAVVFYSSHISSLNDQPIVFADDEAGLPDGYAQALFRMSSRLPPRIWNVAKKEYAVSELAHGYTFNADLVSVIRFLDIGTRVSQNLR
jgi:hypothetical protein